MPGIVDGRAGTQGGQIALVAESVGFVVLAVVLLMPVKVTTFVGAVYVPHGFVQVYDFDPNTICESRFSPWRRERSPP